MYRSGISKRESGTSGYTLKKLINLWLRYWNFSVIPLRISFFLGLFSGLAGVIIAVLIVVNRIIYPDVPVGWSSTLCVMVVLFGLVLIVRRRHRRVPQENHFDSE